MEKIKGSERENDRLKEKIQQEKRYILHINNLFMNKVKIKESKSKREREIKKEIGEREREGKETTKEETYFVY